MNLMVSCCEFRKFRNTFSSSKSPGRIQKMLFMDLKGRFHEMTERADKREKKANDRKRIDRHDRFNWSATNVVWFFH